MINLKELILYTGPIFLLYSCGFSESDTWNNHLFSGVQCLKELSLGRMYPPDLYQTCEHAFADTLRTKREPVEVHQMTFDPI